MIRAETFLTASEGDIRVWDDLVNNSPTPDTYFRPGYAAAYTDESTSAFALLLHTSKRRFLLPLLRRRVSTLPFATRVEDYDAVTPYGYGGILPLEAGNISGEEATELITELRRWCLSANVVSCMLRLHPMLTQESGFRSAQECAGGRLRLHGRTKAIDLIRWDEDLDAPAGMSINRRQNLRTARRNLSLAVASCDTQEGMELMEKFRRIYEETMRRVNASPYYFFPHSYYFRLKEGLGEKLAVAIASRGEEAVGGVLFFADAQFGHYHLCGTTVEGLRCNAQTMVLVAAADWTRRRGGRWFHLGGGRVPDDSLYQFKASFGAATFLYSYVTVIANYSRYTELVSLRHAHQELGRMRAGYFPAYRS
jgi:hypothetical protein